MGNSFRFSQGLQTRWGLTPCETLKRCILLTALALTFQFSSLAAEDGSAKQRLKFNPLPELPDAIGVAGPVVGVDQDRLIVAGGANFARPENPELWELPKIYHDVVWVMEVDRDLTTPTYTWLDTDEPLRLSEKIGYASVVSTQRGVLVLGGENANGLTARAFLLKVQKKQDGLGFEVIEFDQQIPDLPAACKGGGAAVIGDYVYLVAGEMLDSTGVANGSRMIWRLNLKKISLDPNSDLNQQSELWEPLPGWPAEGPPRMFPLVASQHDGFTDRLLVFSGRYFPQGKDHADANNLEFLTDAWSFDLTGVSDEGSAGSWKKIADCPVPMTAGTAVAYGPAHVIVPGYATGQVLKKQLESGTPMKEFDHPGFPKLAYAYHTITDSWTKFGAVPANQVTTPAVRWGTDLFLVSGEIRPRVRTRKVWRIEVPGNKQEFGWLNMTVVVLYLLAMVGVGVFFSFRNRSTDDYFRGGKSIPWWAAGCSIFATMLSSITYMAVPAKAFAQDWVYALGSSLILCVVPIAVYVALPFFRRIDATSAYEYLELRFNRAARLIGSGSFSLFHIFRMGVVLALAGLALASVTPLNPAQCVLVMGGLSIVYCTLGGIEAVIWTDTIQTFVLIGGAIACIFFAWNGADPGSFSEATEAGKFHMVNFEFGKDSFAVMAVWVVVLGGFGQNLASYTADQAVVQRYMTTPDQKLAARSIWLNGLMAIPAAAIFFGMGTAFWMFYRSHPESLDPTIAADRIMPYFISQELPIGIAGLVVAGIFAAAQSTVSTSMNSGATTIVTDFLKPVFRLSGERKALWCARVVTLAMGLLGTAAGLIFINPEIKSLFDEFIGILGMFLGVLAGLFALGATTRRANGVGSLIGALTAILFMMALFFAGKDNSVGIYCRSWFDFFGLGIYRVNGYLYAFIGIAVCYLIGYTASLGLGKQTKDISGLTLWK